MMEKKVLIESKSDKKSTLLDEKLYMRYIQEEEPCSRTEIIVLSFGSTILCVCTIVLFLNMKGDWTADPILRQRVLAIAFPMFIVNVLLACYLIQKMNVQCCTPLRLHRHYRDLEANNSMMSVNESLMSSRDMPPTYDAIVNISPACTYPPIYSEVRPVVPPFESTHIQTKETG